MLASFSAQLVVEGVQSYQGVKFMKDLRLMVKGLIAGGGRRTHLAGLCGLARLSRFHLHNCFSDVHSASMNLKLWYSQSTSCSLVCVQQLSKYKLCMVCAIVSSKPERFAQSLPGLPVQSNCPNKPQGSVMLLNVSDSLATSEKVSAPWHWLLPCCSLSFTPPG